MKNIFVIFLLISATFIHAQDNTEQDVEGVIKTFFKAFHKGDSILLKSTMAEKPIFQTAFKNKEQKDVLKQDNVSGFIKAIGSGRPVAEKWEERILSYTIKVDGNMANAWTEYEFWLDGKF